MSKIDVFEGIKAAETGMLEMGLQLAKGKWRPLIELDGCEEIQSDYKKALTAIMLENTAHELYNMEETTKVANIASFQKFAFPIVRAIMPQMVATDLVSVQPMQGPISLIFFLDFLYGRTKGATTAGTSMFTSSGSSSYTNPGAVDKNYSSQYVDAELVGTGNNSTLIYDAVLSYTPVIPGSVTLNWTAKVGGAKSTVDNGAGAFTAVSGFFTSGTINYTTGAIHLVFVTDPPSDVTTPITVTYQYDLETNTNLPEMDIVLTSTSVTAQTRKLRARWSLTAEQDAKSLHGLDIDGEMATAIGTEVQYEIDQQIAAAIRAMAKAGVGDWSMTQWNRKAFNGPSNYISWAEHKWSFIDHLNVLSKTMFKKSGRAMGNWVLCGAGVSTVFESLQPRFKPMKYNITQGIHKIGVLDGKYDVYEDFSMADLDYTMGYKGDSFLQAGYVYAPYVPFILADVMLDDFIKRKAMMTRYGTKAIRSDFYVNMTMLDA